MFKFTQIDHMSNPPSCGGNYEAGTYTRVCFSNSPKKATTFRGVVVSQMQGVEGCPIMQTRRLERDGKVIFDLWD